MNSVYTLKKIFLLLSVCFCYNANGQLPLVSLENNSLKYTLYSNQGENSKLNRIPDFSYAGYKGGGVSIPNVPVVKTIESVSADCHKLIQDAIDEISLLAPDKNGIRGAVLLKKGIYVLTDSVVIRTDGIVLRGEGAGMDGTVIVATRKAKCTPLQIRGSGSGYGEVAGSRVKIASAYVGTGSVSFDIPSGHSFAVGDKVVIQKTPNDAWIGILDMAQYGWVAKDYKVTFERKIVKIEGNTIHIDIPVVDAFQDAYGGAEIFKSSINGRINNCGIENIRIESYFAGNEDESHGWNAIILKRAENCWVKNIVAKYFGYACVNISDMSVFNTVEDCAMIDPKAVTTGGRKYSFNLESNSTCNLFNRCFTWGGRHDFVTGSRLPGPNVFLDCNAENTFSDIGPHHRWATGLLFDNVRGGQIHVQNRKDMGSGHGWAGAQVLFWNCNSYKNDIKVESPPSARNWGIGCTGLKQNGGGYWENWGNNVSPRSLYLEQLKERLGDQALINVTTDAQRNGNIWDDLKNSATKIASEQRVITFVPHVENNTTAGTPSVTYSSGMVSINLNSRFPEETKELKIFNVCGNSVFQSVYPEDIANLIVGHLSKGIYILNLTTEHQVYKLKFLLHN